MVQLRDSAHAAVETTLFRPSCLAWYSFSSAWRISSVGVMPGSPEVVATPSWRELRERFRDLIKDVLQEGKEIERELEPKLLPALRRLKSDLEKLITKLEQRAAKQDR